jgi:nucleotide-binding universal stress UspA family protein
LAEGHPAEEILKVATRQRAHVIVMGSRGLAGVKRFLMGSVSQQVVRHAPCSVLLVRR